MAEIRINIGFYLGGYPRLFFEFSDFIFTENCPQLAA
jgi:hypothetical protein